MLENNQLKKLQGDLFLILQEFDRVCKKNHIDYILGFGTALGAVRHGGFIPWDDDIDVCIDQKGYAQLLEVLDKDLGPCFYYQCYEKDKRYNVTLPPMKIRMKNREMKERFGSLHNKSQCCDLFLDVFVMDSVSESKWIHMTHKALSKSFGYVLNTFEYFGFSPQILKEGMIRYSNWYAEKYQDSQLMDLILRWPHEPLKYMAIRKDHVFPPRKIMFNGALFPVANHVDDYLTTCYGDDYMIPPCHRKQVPKHFVLKKKIRNMHVD